MLRSDGFNELEATVRLEVIKVLVPTASRHSLATDEILQIAGKLSDFVLGSAHQSSGKATSDSPVKETLGVPRKGKHKTEGLPDFMAPQSVDKSNQASE